MKALKTRKKAVYNDPVNSPIIGVPEELIDSLDMEALEDAQDKIDNFVGEQVKSAYEFIQAIENHLQQKNGQEEESEDEGQGKADETGTSEQSENDKSGGEEMTDQQIEDEIEKQMEDEEKEDQREEKEKEEEDKPQRVVTEDEYQLLQNFLMLQKAGGMMNLIMSGTKNKAGKVNKNVIPVAENLTESDIEKTEILFNKITSQFFASAEKVYASKGFVKLSTNDL